MANLGNVILSISADNKNALSGISQIKQSLGNLKGDLGAIGTVAASAFGAFAAFNFLKEQTAEVLQFNKEMVSLQFLVSGTTDDIKQTEKEVSNLANTFHDLSRATGLSAIELQKAAGAAGRVGVDTGEMPKFLETLAATVTLAPDFAASMDEAADKTAKLTNVAGLGFDSVTKLVSSLDRAGDSSAASGGEIADITLRLGGVISKYGKTNEELERQAASMFGVAATIKDIGMNTEAGSTAFVRGIGDMIGQEAEYAAFIEKAIGQGAEFQKVIGVDNAKATELFVKALSTMDTKSQIQAMQELGQNAIFVQQLFTGLANDKGLELWAKNQKAALTGLLDGEGFMEKFRKINETPLQQLKRSWEDVKQIFTNIIETIGGAVAPFISLLNEMLDPIVSFSKGVKTVLQPAFYVVSTAVTGVIKALNLLLDTLFPFLTSTDAAGEKVHALGKAFEYLGWAIGVVAIAKIPSMISGLASLVSPLGGLVSGAGTAAASFLGFVKTTSNVGGAVSSIGAISGAIAGVQGTTASAVGGIVGSIGGIQKGASLAIAGITGIGGAATVAGAVTAAAGVTASIAWGPFIAAIVGVIAVIGLFKLAWDTNFYGFQDKITAMIDKVVGFFNVLVAGKEVFDNVFGGEKNQKINVDFELKGADLEKAKTDIQELGLTATDAEKMVANIGKGVGAEEDIATLQQYKDELVEMGLHGDDLKRKLGEAVGVLSEKQDGAFTTFDEFKSKMDDFGLSAETMKNKASMKEVFDTFGQGEGLNQLDGLKMKYEELGLSASQASEAAFQFAQKIAEAGGDETTLKLANAFQTMGYSIDESATLALKFSRHIGEMKKAWDSFKTGPIFAQIKDNFYTIIGTITYVVEVVLKKFKGVFDAIMSISNTVVTYFRNVTMAFGQFILGVFQLFSGEAKKGLNNIVGAIWKFISSLFIFLKDLVIGVAKLFWELVKIIGVSLWNGLKIAGAFVLDLWENFKLALAKIAVAFAAGAKSAIQAWTNIDWSQVGVNMWNSLVAGITAIGQKLIEWGQKVKDWWNSLFSDDEGQKDLTVNAAMGPVQGPQRDVVGEAKKTFWQEIQDTAGKEYSMANTSAAISSSFGGMNAALGIEQTDMKQRGVDAVNWFADGVKTGTEKNSDGLSSLKDMLGGGKTTEQSSPSSAGGGSGGSGGGASDKSGKEEAEKDRLKKEKEVQEEYEREMHYVEARRKIKKMVQEAMENVEKIQINLASDSITSTDANGLALFDSVQKTADSLAQIDYSKGEIPLTGFTENAKKEFLSLQERIEKGGESISAFVSKLKDGKGSNTMLADMKKYLEDITETLIDAGRSVEMLGAAFNSLYLQAKDKITALKDEISKLKDELDTGSDTLDYEISIEEQKTKIAEARSSAEEKAAEVRKKAANGLLEKERELQNEARKLQILQMEGASSMDIGIQEQKLAAMQSEYDLQKSIQADAKNDPSVKAAYEKIDALTAEQKKMELLRNISTGTANTSGGRLVDGGDLAIFDNLSKIDQLRVQKAILQKEKQDEITSATEKSASYEALVNGIKEGQIAIVDGIVQKTGEQANLSQGMLEAYQKQYDLLAQSNDAKTMQLANEIATMSATQERFAKEKEQFEAMQLLQKEAMEQTKLFWEEERKVKEEQLKADLDAIDATLDAFTDLTTEQKRMISETKDHNIMAIDAVIAELKLQQEAGQKAASAWQVALQSYSAYQSALTAKKGYRDGGFTGSGGLNDVAGVVHRGEYVIPNHVLKKVEPTGLLGMLEKMRGGFKTGGPTSISPKTFDNSKNITQNITQNIKGGQEFDSFEELLFMMANRI